MEDDAILAELERLLAEALDAYKHSAPERGEKASRAEYAIGDAERAFAKRALEAPSAEAERARKTALELAHVRGHLTIAEKGAQGRAVPMLELARKRLQGVRQGVFPSSDLP